MDLGRVREENLEVACSDPESRPRVQDDGDGVRRGEDGIRMGCNTAQAVGPSFFCPLALQHKYQVGTREVLTWHGEPVQLVEHPSFRQPLTADLWPLRPAFVRCASVRT